MPDEMDRFFTKVEKELYLDSIKKVRESAMKLEREVKAQVKNIYPPKLISGVRRYDFENSSVVRLSPILSQAADPQTLKGNPNLRILLPDGKRLGFKRNSKLNFNSNSYFYKKVQDGTVIIYRHSDGRNYAIYKLQKVVNQKQKINFYNLAESIIKDD